MPNSARERSLLIFFKISFISPRRIKSLNATYPKCTSYKHGLHVFMYTKQSCQPLSFTLRRLSPLSLCRRLGGREWPQTVPGSTRHTVSLTRTHAHPPIPCTHLRRPRGWRARAQRLRVGLSRDGRCCLSIGQVVARAVRSLGGRSDRCCEQNTANCPSADSDSDCSRLPTELTLGREYKRSRSSERANER